MHYGELHVSDHRFVSAVILPEYDILYPALNSHSNFGIDKYIHGQLNILVLPSRTEETKHKLNFWVLLLRTVAPFATAHTSCASRDGQRKTGLSQKVLSYRKVLLHGL